jgi:hypothetical protein
MEVLSSFHSLLLLLDTQSYYFCHLLLFYELFPDCSRQSVSPTHGGPSRSGKKSSRMTGGDHGEPERGIVIHRITKEVVDG